MNRSAGKATTAAITIAAVAAVAFWSLKPVLISVIGDRGDYAEVYVVAGAISVLTSLLVAAIFWKRSVAVVRGGRTTGKAILWAGLSGLFLAMWYYGFYRALYGTAKADATVIAFTWPLIAAIAIRLISPGTAGKLKPNQWLLIGASFLGAVAIGVANVGASPRGEASGEIVWAFVAAIGSGLYLPFAFKATSALETRVRSKPLATFYSISIANVVSLLAVLLVLFLAGHRLRFYAFDAQVLLVCAIIGIGTYLVAEVMWTWAFQEYKSLTLSSLPYFSPAVSVILLHVLFQEPVRPIAIVGLVLILFSNLTLHASQRSTNALSLTLIATVYVALASQILPTGTIGSAPEMAAALTGLFAILAGFILARAAGRRTQEVDARAVLVSRLIAVDGSAGKELADKLLRSLMDLEFETDREQQDSKTAKLRALLADGPAQDAAARKDARDAFSSWLAMHQDRLSIGETAALWLTGIGSVVFVLLLRDVSPFGQAGSIIFAAGAFLAIFTIRDYDRNNLHGFRNQLRRLEQGFSEIGKPYYVPADVVEAGQLSGAEFKRGVRRETADGRIEVVRNFPGSRLFNSFYLGTAALVILAVIVLPISSVAGPGAGGVAAPRPGESQGSLDPGGDARTIVIADPGWAGATVAAEIIKSTLEAQDISVTVEKVDHTTAVSELIKKDAKIQVHPDLWLQNQNIAVREAIESGAVRLSDHHYAATQGIYILDDQRTRGLVKDLNSLTDPAVAALFDTTGDGRGEMWIGARGWSTTESLKTWLDNGVPTMIGEAYSETIFKAKLAEDAKTGRPSLFYGYVPDGIHEKYALRRLGDVPGETAAKEVDASVARSAEVAALSPTADRILARIGFDTHDVNGFIKACDDGVEPAKVAEQWITAHRDRVDGWTKTR
ncbi:glycine betaine ABC transporter substrate-binding protein [Microlunatus speluncae]|uniref:glycine betaine ABC transporter substrate-binding protein n=1 Tax=Microlunatus speluncae TaxID=2594267 RepID=UPI0012664BF2|nr:glycine betaine ABC transporter substrate-binding protein [Microlunatus speluncae]